MKFYPWKEQKSKKARDGGVENPSPDPVQLYDTVPDIGGTKNLASKNPEVFADLQKAYDAHVAEIEANRRPTAEMKRPEGAMSPERPGKPRKKKA